MLGKFDVIAIFVWASVAFLMANSSFEPQLNSFEKYNPFLTWLHEGISIWSLINAAYYLSIDVTLYEDIKSF